MKTQSIKNSNRIAIDPQIIKKALTALATAAHNVSDPDVMKKDQAALKNGDLLYTPVSGTLSVGGVSYDDVDQGQIGDCYFMAALSAVTKANPAFVRDSIRLNKDGTYNVRFFKDGKPIYVNVDNDFLHDKWGRPVYGTSKDKGELWVAVMEKAYAKLNHSYENIGKGGDTKNALQTLTGISTQSFDPGSVSDGKLYDTLNSAFKSGLPVTAGTSYNQALYANTGIVPTHAYTVTGVSVKNGQPFVTVRNPWGQVEWNGSADGKNDGIFEIPLADFKKYFPYVSLTKSAPKVHFSGVHLRYMVV